MTVDALTVEAASATAGVLLTAAVAFWHPVRSRRQRDRDIANAVLGSPPRPGVDGQPSMVERFDLLTAAVTEQGRVLAAAALLNGKGEALAADIAALRTELRDLVEEQSRARVVHDANLAAARAQVRAVRADLTRHVKGHG